MTNKNVEMVECIRYIVYHLLEREKVFVINYEILAHKKFCFKDY